MSGPGGPRSGEISAAAAAAGGAILQVAPAAVSAEAAAAFVDGAVGFVELAVLEQGVDGAQHQAQVVLLLLRGDAQPAQIGARLAGLGEARRCPVGDRE